MTIYSNTTPLLAFPAIGRLDFLNKVHGEIRVVPSVGSGVLRFAKTADSGSKDERPQVAVTRTEAKCR